MLEDLQRSFFSELVETTDSSRPTAESPRSEKEGNTADRALEKLQVSLQEPEVVFSWCKETSAKLA